MSTLSTDPATAPWPAPAPPAGPLLASAAKRTKRQEEAAAIITTDAACTPVYVRAAIVGRARMPRAALEITSVDGVVLGHVSLVNTSAAFDPNQRFWLVGIPEPGSVVALVSEGATQVILPGGRLRTGPAPAQEFSDVACRMLGWQAPSVIDGAPPGWAEVLNGPGTAPNNPRFLAAVKRFRTAAVLIPVLFFLVCFPYLFVIPREVHSGSTMLSLLAFPVLGGLAMTVWSYRCRRELVAEAELIEPGASRWGREIAFTQSYWSGLRKPSVSWDGPIPVAVH